jgi:hypothetical protein
MIVHPWWSHWRQCSLPFSQCTRTPSFFTTFVNLYKNTQHLAKMYKKNFLKTQPQSRMFVDMTTFPTFFRETDDPASVAIATIPADRNSTVPAAFPGLFSISSSC